MGVVVVAVLFLAVSAERPAGFEGDEGPEEVAVLGIKAVVAMKLCLPRGLLAGAGPGE